MTPPEKKPSFRVEDGDDEDSSALDDLSNQLEREKDARKEERFLLVTAIIVIADAFMFSAMENWAGAIVIGVIELVALAVLARKWGVQEVSQFLAMFFQNLADRSNPPSANNHTNSATDEKPSQRR